MPLEFRRQRDGRLRDIWFGAFEINGKRYGINLGVKIVGTPPASLSLKDKGDTEYEVSRMAALAKLEHFIEEARKKNHTEHLVEKLYEIKTGETIKSVKLGALADEWAKIARRREPNARYASQCQSTLKRFAAFVRQENPKVLEIAQITRTLARAFMDAEAKRGVTGKTWNDTLKLLRATFKYLLPAGGINPFADTPTRETDTVFRHPFTPEELGAINEAAKADEFIRPIIIVGMCSAMRRGDCCLLKWEDVDLGNRFITVKTSKTGQTVSIPIFPMLQDELKRKADSTPHPCPLPDRGGEGVGKRKAESGKQKAISTDTSSGLRPPSPQSGEGKGYVFPEQARMYLENPDGITWRVKKILAVGLNKETAESRKQKAEIELPKVDDEETRRRGLEYIAKLENPDKGERMKRVFEHYLDGNKVCLVASNTGTSKGSVSGYLNEIEAAIGCRIIRGASRTGHQAEGGKRKAELTGLQVERKHGLRRASVRDFHSFRVTWVTLALTAGVPLELVQKVTGHKTTDIVLKHYFQPGREAFRSALNAAMPALLTNGQKGEDGGSKMEDGVTKKLKPVVEKQDKAIRAILERSTAKTWKQDQARVLAMLKGKSSN